MKTYLNLVAFILFTLQLNAQNVGVGTDDPLARFHTQGFIKDVIALDYDMENGVVPSGEHESENRWRVDSEEAYKSTYSLVSPVNLSANDEVIFAMPYSVDPGRVVELSFWFKKIDPEREITVNLEWSEGSIVLEGPYNEWTPISKTFVSKSESGVIRLIAESLVDKSQVKANIDDIMLSYETGYALNITDGTEAQGYILVSDEVGNAKWFDLRTQILEEVGEDDQELIFNKEQHQLSIENGNKVNISGLRNDDFRRIFMHNDTLESTSGFSLLLPKNGPQQPGFFWDQKKGALLLGRDPTDGSPDHGSYAMRWGISNQVNGIGATAFGLRNKAESAYSVSWGTDNRISGDRSTAWGEDNLVTGAVSTAWGIENRPLDSLATVWGENNFAGLRSTVWGVENTASSELSTMWGYSNRSTGTLGTVWGEDNLVNDSLAVAWGRNNTAGKLTTVWGSNNVGGNRSTVIGEENSNLNGVRNLILGNNNFASRHNGFVMGWGNSMTQDSSFLLGHNNVPNKTASILIGNRLQTNGGFYEIAMGRYNYSSVGSFFSGFETSDHLFTLGNGTSTARSNAIAVYNNSGIRLGYDGAELSDNVTSTVEITEKPGTNSSASLLIDSNNSNNSSMRLRSTASNTIEFRKSGSDFRVIHHSTNDHLRFHDSNTSGSNGGLFLVEGNNVGISKSSPGFNLELGFNSAAKPASSSWIVSSDRRLKKNVEPFSGGLTTVLAINPVWFTYNGKAGIPQQQGIGTIAQDLERIAPYMVTEFEHQEEEGRIINYKAVDYGAMDFILVNAIKEQQKIIENQQNQINEQNALLLDMINRLEKLEQN